MDDKEFNYLFGIEDTNEQSTETPLSDEEFSYLFEGGDTSDAPTSVAKKPQVYNSAVLSIIDKKAAQYNLNPAFLKALAKHESGLNPNANSHTGAKGLFQFIPSTAKSYGIDPLNPEEASDAAAQFMDGLDRKYSGDVNKMLAAYNAGEGVVDEASRLAEQYGTTWEQEILNTKSLENVARLIKKHSKSSAYKNASIEEIKELKYKEILNHRNQVLTAYSEFDTTPQPTETQTESQQEEEQSKGPSILDGIKTTFGRTLNILASIPGIAAELNVGSVSGGGKYLSPMEEDFTPSLDMTSDIKFKMVKDLSSNKIVKFAGEIEKNVPKINDKYKSVGDAAAKGPAALLEYVMFTGLENSGTMALLIGSTIATGGAGTGLAALGAGSAGVKNKELMDRIESKELEMSDAMRMLNATGTGAAEALPEIFGSASILNVFKKSFTNVAKKAGTEVAKTALKSNVVPFVTGFLKGWGIEFTDENITEISNLITDNVTGARESKGIQKEISDYVTTTMPELAAATWVSAPMSAATEVNENKKLRDSQTTETPVEGPMEQDIQPDGEESDLTEEEQTILGILKPEQEANAPVSIPSAGELNLDIPLSEEQVDRNKTMAKVITAKQSLLDKIDSMSDEDIAKLTKKFPEVLDSEARNFTREIPEVELGNIIETANKIAQDSQSSKTKSETPTKSSPKLTEEPVTAQKIAETTKVTPTAESKPVEAPMEPVDERLTRGEINATDEQVNTVRTLASKIDGVVFQGSNPGIENNGKVLMEPTMEFREETTKGNFTIPLSQVTPENINKKILALRESNKATTKQTDELAKEAVKPKEETKDNIFYHGSNVAVSKPDEKFTPILHLSENKETAQVFADETTQMIGEGKPTVSEVKTGKLNLLKTKDTEQDLHVYGENGEGILGALQQQELSDEDMRKVNYLIAKAESETANQEDIQVEAVRLAQKLGYDGIEYENKAEGAKGERSVGLFAKLTEKAVEPSKTTEDTETAPKPESKPVRPSMEASEQDKLRNRIIKDKKATLAELEELDPPRIHQIATNLDIPIKSAKRFRQKNSIIADIISKIGSVEDKGTVKEKSANRNKKTGQASKKGRKAGEEKRLAETGDSRTPQQKAYYEAVKQLNSEGVVEYSENNKSLLDETTSVSGVSFPLFIKAKMNGKEYIFVNKGMTKEDIARVNKMHDTKEITDKEYSRILIDSNYYNKTYIKEDLHKGLNRKANKNIEGRIKYILEGSETTSYNENVGYDDESSVDSKDIASSDATSEEPVSTEIGMTDDSFEEIEFDNPKEVIQYAKDKVAELNDRLEKDEITDKEYEILFEELTKQVRQALKNNKISLSTSGNLQLMRKRGDGKEGSTITNKTVRDVLKLFDKNKMHIAFGNPRSPARYKGKEVDNFMEKDGEVYGGFSILNDGTVLITVNTAHPDAMGTIIHEAFGHFGAYKVFNAFPELEEYARDLFRRDKGSDLRKDIAKNYGSNKEIQFQEWVATNVEKIGKKFFKADGSLDTEAIAKTEGVVKKLFEKIRKIIGKLINKKPSSKEVDDMVSAIFFKLTELQDVTADVGEGSNRQKIKDVPEKVRLLNKEKARNLLETAESLNGTKNRFLKYLLHHVYTKGDKDLLVGLVQTARSNDKDSKGHLTDPNFELALKFIDSASYRGDLNRAISQFNRASKGLLSNSPMEIKDIIAPMIPLIDDANEYRRLESLVERNKYKARLTDEGNVRIGETTRPLIEKGYVSEVEIDGEKYIQITDKGTSRYNALKEKMTSLTLEGEPIDLIDYIESKTVALKLKKSEFSDVKKSIRADKSDAVKNKAQEIVDGSVGHLKESPDIVDRNYRSGIIKKIMDGLKSFDLTTVNLKYITESLDNFKDNGPFRKYIYNPLRDGLRKKYEFERNSVQKFQDGIKGISDIESFSEAFKHGAGVIAKGLKKNEDVRVTKYKYSDVNGNTFSITKDQRVAIARLSESRAGLRHLLSENGGIVLQSDSNRVFKLNPTILKNILADMTDGEKQLAGAIKGYFDFQKDEINQVSVADVGFELASEDNYHPILTLAFSQKFQDKEVTLDVFQQFAMESQYNNLKRRTKGSNPIVLEGAMEAMVRTNEMISDYVGMAIPVRDVKRLLQDNGAKIAARGKETTLRNYIIENGRQQELKAIEHILGAIDGTRRERLDPRATKWFKFFRNAITVGALAGNPTVVLMQPLGYFSAATQGLKLTSSMQLKKNKQTLIDFYNHSPVLWKRFQGMIDRDIGETRSMGAVRSFTESKGILSLDEKSPKELFKMWTTVEGLMSFLTRGDAVAIGAIANDVKLEIESQGYKYGTDEFWDKASRRLEEIVESTQPTYEVLNRPSITNSEVMKPFTMFLSQPIKNLMIVRKSIAQLKYALQHKEESGSAPMFRKAVGDLSMILVLQPLLVTAIREIMMSLRGKERDEDDTLLKSFFMGWFTANISMYPFIGGLIADAIQGYDMGGSQPMIESLSAIGKATARTYKLMSGNGDDEDFEKLGRELTRSLSSVGVPAIAISQYYEIIANTTKTLTEAVEE